MLDDANVTDGETIQKIHEDKSNEVDKQKEDKLAQLGRKLDSTKVELSSECHHYCLDHRLLHINICLILGMKEEVEGEGKGKHKPEQPEQYLEEVFADGSEHGGVDCNAREVCGEEERVHPAEKDGETGELLQPDNPINRMLVSRSRFVSW